MLQTNNQYDNILIIDTYFSKKRNKREGKTLTKALAKGRTKRHTFPKKKDNKENTSDVSALTSYLP